MSAFPSSFRPCPLAPTPQKESLSEFCIKRISVHRSATIYFCHLNQFRIASGKELSLQVRVLCKFEQQYFVHLKHAEKLASWLVAYVPC